MKQSLVSHFLRVGTVLLIVLGLSCGGHATADTTVTIVNGQSSLTAAGTYSSGTVPTNGSNNDIVFTGTYSPAAFTLSGTTTAYFGTLNDVSSTALTISNGTSSTVSTINLGGAGVSNGYGSANGGNSGDLLFVGSSSNLTIQNGSGTLTIALTSAGNLDIAGSSTISSAVNDGGYGITKTGAGTLVLGASNSITGSLTVSGGTLQLGTGSAGLIGSSPTASIASGSILSFGLATGTTDSGNISDLGTLEGIETSGVSNTLSGGISGSGVLTQLGFGTTVLSGTNTYTGATTISEGTLEFTKEVSLYNNQSAATWSTSNIIVQNGATLAVEVGNTGGFTSTDIGTLLGLATSNGGFESGSNLGIDTTGGNFTYGTALTNLNSGSNVLGLTKLGSNTLTLTGVNTYNGPTIISSGTLTLGGAGQLGSGNYSSSLYNSGAFIDNSSANQTISGSIGGSGSVTNSGSGTLTLSNANFYTGSTSVSAGVLDLNNSLALQNSSLSISGTGSVVFDSSVLSNAFSIGGLGSNGNLVLQNSAGTGITLTVGGFSNSSSTYTGVLSGSGALSTFGISNTLTLQGANTYTGLTTIGGGTLNLGGGTATGSINSNSGLVLSNGILAYTRTGTVSQTFNGILINTGQNSITESTATQTINLGAITNNAGATVDFSNVGTITTSNGNTNGILGGYATYGGKTTWATVSGGVISGLASGSYTESATAGTSPTAYLNQNIDVNGSETLTGSTTINSLRYNSSTAYTMTLTGLNTITSGGVLLTPTATAGGTITGGTLTGSASGQLAFINGANSTLNVGSLIVDNGGPTAVVTSAPNNLNGLSLTNANNSFSGGLYIEGGHVLFNGANGGTAFGVGNVTIGNNNSVYTGIAGGTVEFNGASLTVTSGLLVDPYGVNASNGNISNSTFSLATWTLIGSGTASFNGIIGNYAPGRVVNLILDSGTEIIGNTQLGSSGITVNGGTLQLGNGYFGSFSQNYNNMALTVGGGTFDEYGNFAGTTSQGFNSGLAVKSGASTIIVNNNGGAGTVVSLTGAITRSVGGTVNFSLPTGTQSIYNGITTVTLNTNGILGGYATVGGTDWATNSTNTSGGNIVAYSGYTNDVWAAANNTTVTTNDSPTSGSTTNSLRFNAAGANTVTLAGTNIITSGGILVTSNVGANLSTITGGTLEGGSSTDLVVIQNNTSAGLTIGSLIADNGGATALTKSGAGLLTLTNSSNSYTGGLYLNGGTLNATGGAINSSSTTNGIFFNGGTFQAANAITTGKAISIGVNGATVDLNGNNMTFSGAVSSAAAGNNVGAGLYGAFDPTGEGAFTINNSGSAATITLSSASNAFYGGLNINGNSTVKVSNAAAGTLGGGYITFGTSNNPTVDLNGNSPTVAGLNGSGTNGVVTNTNAGSSTLTLNGTTNSTYNGVINNGSGTVGLTVSLNNPTTKQTLGGANTYTGTTSVTAGILLVGNGTTGSISSSSAISVTGGSLLFNNPSTAKVTLGAVTLGGGNLGFASNTVSGSQSSFGALTLLSGTTSSLNFGSMTGGNTLTFSSITAASATAVLNIFNYGTSSANYLLSSTTLNATTLNDIVFYSGSDTSSTYLGTGGEVTFGSFQQVVPTPEPSTYISGIFLLGLLGWRYLGLAKINFSL